ncbi:MAG: signal peptidase II [Limnochordaceae bacterium]|nr:signal peptidase II [Limnochordaceae bacterium]
MSHVRRDYGMVLAWAAGTLAVDQAAKWAVSRWLGPGESVGVAGRLIRLTHVTNPGAAFGLFQGRQELFVAATLLVFVLAVVMAGRVGPKSGLALAGLGLAAGARRATWWIGCARGRSSTSST